MCGEKGSRSLLEATTHAGKRHGATTEHLVTRLFPEFLQALSSSRYCRPTPSGYHDLREAAFERFPSPAALKDTGGSHLMDPILLTKNKVTPPVATACHHHRALLFQVLPFQQRGWLKERLVAHEISKKACEHIQPPGPRASAHWDTQSCS